MSYMMNVYNEARFAEEEVFLLFTQYFFDKNIYTHLFLTKTHERFVLCGTFLKPKLK